MLVKDMVRPTEKDSQGAQHGQLEAGAELTCKGIDKALKKKLFCLGPEDRQHQISEHRTGSSKPEHSGP